MLVDETKYIWSKWQQPIFTGNDTWGEVTASSVHKTTEGNEPYFALDNDENTHWEGEDRATTVQFTWIFDKPLKIYRIELVNKPTGSSYVTKDIEVYVDDEMTEILLSGSFELKSRSKLSLESEQPFACDRLIFNLTGERYVGLSSIRIIAEVGQEKTVLTPFLNSSEGMEFISDGYNDDSTFTTAGMDGFMFNAVAASNIYISSNHWIGFGVGSEQLRILRRDGCSTAIYRMLGETTNGLQFLKIRFEGYTVYRDRVESNRLIFELFILSNNDMFLNVIQTPTSGNTGESNLVCNGTTTPLELFDGQGGGAMVSFYHQDPEGKNWNIVYGMYEETDTYSFAYLLQLEDGFYSIEDESLISVDIENLTSAMFLKYGFEELPSSELFSPLANPQMYLWKAGGSEELLKAKVKAYPFPQTLESVIDMSHISILGIKLLTAEYSGDVRIQQSLDNGETFSNEIALSDWLNVDPEELYNSLNETKILILHFILHDNAAISRFKITYIN